MFPAFWYLMTVVNRRCLKEACQFLNSIYYCLTHFAGHLNIRLDMHSVDYECALCPIQSWINATDELITIEYGHQICVDEPLARKFTVPPMDAHPHNMPLGP